MQNGQDSRHRKGLDQPNTRRQAASLFKIRVRVLKEPASQHEADNRVGQGTAICDVLVRIAKVHLYVGKVADKAAFDDKVLAKVAQSRDYPIHLPILPQHTLLHMLMWFITRSKNPRLMGDR
ncbi:hypothetical protein F5144DRAFT_550726 [Chaetomium tenue]|uniref:Uncharacterized protein n=1 Tax=Chaetomium tenue TaxID=1854479 RepID=A0ACB7NY08_9PEZI|nr:hypothetical protein F5144DRAFT_550726 [Chaetomium globosum]